MSAAPPLHWTLSVLGSRAVVLTRLASVLWAPSTGSPTWPARARGRYASSLAVSLVVGVATFTLCRAICAARAGG